jgi:hypothetical protein
LIELPPETKPLSLFGPLKVRASINSPFSLVDVLASFTVSQAPSRVVVTARNPPSSAALEPLRSHLRILDCFNMKMALAKLDRFFMLPMVRQVL